MLVENRHAYIAATSGVRQWLEVCETHFGEKADGPKSESRPDLGIGFEFVMGAINPLEVGIPGW